MLFWHSLARLFVSIKQAKMPAQNFCFLPPFDQLSAFVPACNMSLYAERKNGIICDEINDVTKTFMIIVFLRGKLLAFHKLTTFEYLQVLLMNRQKSFRNSAFL